MSNIISFKERVAETVSKYAHDYKSVFVDCEYLVCSEAFSINPYYIISASENNYLHLTGVSFYDSQVFFDKCISSSLLETDISFHKYGESEKAVKGSVRRKITVLPNFINAFTSYLKVEESFSKNRVVCSFGASDSSCPIGFVLVNFRELLVKPMILLSGFELNPNKAKEVDLVLRRAKGSLVFDEIVLGNKSMIEKYKDKIGDLLSDDLKDF